MKFRIESSSMAKPHISGVGYYTKRLTEALGAYEGNDVRAFNFNFLNRQPVPPIAETAQLHIEKLQFPHRVYQKSQSLGFAPPFDFLLPPVDVTIFPNFATWPTMRTKLRGTTIHDLTYLHFPEFMERKNLAHLKRVVAQSVQSSDFILTVSESVKKEIVDNFAIPASSCLVTHVPPDEAYYHPSAIDVHTKYNIPTEKYIFFISTLEPRKNIPLLIEAYRLLPANLKAEYSLVIAGGTDWKAASSLKAIRSAQAAGEKVVQTGYVAQTDAPTLHHKSSLYVTSSTYEGFGMPILEAMAGNTPVVASDIPVHRETAGEAALYAPADNADEFSDRMKTVLTSPSTARQLVKKAHIQLATYSWDKNAKIITNYCKEHLS